MKTRKLVVNDLQLNVSICGQGSPLLLLNGLGGLIRTFDPLREARRGAADAAASGAYAIYRCRARPA